MKKGLLLIAVFFIVVFASAQTDLFFSEYCEGSGNNKGLEIYNPTSQTINLNDYWVVRYSNGSSVFTEGGVTQLQGSLEPYETHVLVNGQTTSTPTSPACSPIMQALADQLDHDYPAPTYMNGNDAIALIKTDNGLPPSTSNPGIPVDLIGQIGLGSLISAETGWSYVQDTTISYNNSQGDPITGKVVNYIVQKYATNGSDFGPFWMSWTSDHSLIRKPNIMQGTVVNPNPFNVGMEWDTVPAKLDTTGYYSYKDIWDNLGSHEYFSNIGPTAVNDEVETGNTLLVAVHVLNNDLYYAPVTVSIDQPPTQGNAEVQPENPNVITYMANPDFIGLDSLSYKISYQANPAFYASAKVYINVTEDIGIEETILNSGMIVYPNPVVAEHFTVGSDKMIQAVQVFDLTGKEIYNKIFASPIREAEISLGNGYHGIYLVKANFTNKQSFSQKILIK